MGTWPTNLWMISGSVVKSMHSELSRAKHFKRKAVEELSLVDHAWDGFDLKASFGFKKI